MSTEPLPGFRAVHSDPASAAHPCSSERVSRPAASSTTSSEATASTNSSTSFRPWDQLVHALYGDADMRRKRNLRDSEGGEELLVEHLAGMGGDAIRRQHQGAPR